MMSDRQLPEKPWPEAAAAILLDIDCLKRAEARHYLALDKRIDGLCADLRVHKVKTGILASMSAGVTILAAWALSLLRAGA